MHATHCSQNFIPVVIGFRVPRKNLASKPDVELLVDLDLSVNSDDLIEAVALSGEEGRLEAPSC
jgi:hypothetical protein